MRISLLLAVVAVLGGCGKKEEAAAKPPEAKAAEPVPPAPPAKPKPTPEECTKLHAAAQLAVMAHSSTAEILVDVVAWHQSHLEDMVKKAKGKVDAPLQTAVDTAAACKAAADAALPAWKACNDAVEAKAKDAATLCKTAQDTNTTLATSWDAFVTAVKAIKMPDDKAVAESAEMLGTGGSATERTRTTPPVTEVLASGDGCE
jgi:hypothetical protein